MDYPADMGYASDGEPTSEDMINLIDEVDQAAAQMADQEANRADIDSDIVIEDEEQVSLLAVCVNMLPSISPPGASKTTVHFKNLCISHLQADDPELEAIRQRRMAEMMAQQGGGGKGPMSAEEQQQQAEAKEAHEDQRRSMLVALLQPAARDRLARIALVKPDKARAIEDMIINAAKRGALGEKVSEDRLIDLLEQVNEKSAAKTRVTIQRRRAFDDDF
ncbi:hypothetical protein KSW81_008095 [Nannochloris sp. 'desiccata']|nr:hypothetical protein KSW81_008095 [Chlorella desiccata (nom. nud.)]